MFVARITLPALLLVAMACSNSLTPIGDDITEDITLDLKLDFSFELPGLQPDLVFTKDTGSVDMLDVDVELPGNTPECDPGGGCFLDSCTDNESCLSGWCVGHMGEEVCTTECESECPPGWACQQIPGTAPDIVFICVSDHANLCLPCATGADCKGAAGEDAPCVDYGQEGSFCGGICTLDDDCPWGFSCVEAQTVDGVKVKQCVADAGVCPCTGKSVALGLFTPCEVVNEVGVCAGKRICTDDGLADCDAAAPQMEVCNGVDDNCDGSADEKTCEDDNDCTEDVCLGEDGCNHIPVETGECKDGDPCTVADHCEAGVCVGDSVVCDDGNLCTTDSCTATGGCEFEAQFGPCDDADPCTAGDLCTQGVCAGTPLDCACLTDDDCQALEDGNLCNGILECETSTLPFQCVVKGDTEVICPGPEGPNAPCLITTCDPDTGECSLFPANDGAPCSEGNPCTMNDTCLDGTCVGGSDVNCNDGNPCTDDVCLPQEVCVYSNNVSACFDGDLCTAPDSCDGGECLAGPAVSCDDGHPCTVDSCDPAVGCTHSAQDGPCDDGNACTVDEQCSNGICGAGNPVDCDDKKICTTEVCDSALGCIYTFNEAPCDDGSLCTFGDHCSVGECIGAQQLTCNDQNICTDDGCNPLSGCTFVPNSNQCEDSNLCTENEQCSGGWCQGQNVSCDDSNQCTNDSCDSELGCQHQYNLLPCDDSDVCTVGGNCSDGACVGGEQLGCDDGETCTDDSCVPFQGCSFVPNVSGCDDDNKCTDGDICSDGDCEGVSVSCDDLEVCTTDDCNPLTGCTHVPVPDETSCGQERWCQNGLCEDKPPQTITFETLNYNGMTGWPLLYEACGCCSGTTDQEQMDALCQLAGFSKATSWVSESKQISNCYCWGVCSAYAWDSNCCSGLQTQVMVTQVTCNK